MFKRLQSKNENYKRSFILAMIVISSTIASIIAINYTIVDKEERMLANVDVSGQQRMLSQRIAFLSELLMQDFNHHKSNHVHQYELRTDTTLLLAQYDEAIDRMENNHKALIQGSEKLNISPPPKRLKEHYFGPEKNLDQSVKTYIEDAKIFKKDMSIILSGNSITPQQEQELFKVYKEIDAMALSSLLTKLDEAVQLYEEHGFHSVSELKLIALGLFIFAMIVLVLVWFIIFNPLTHQLKTTLKAFDLQKSEGERQMQRLDLATKGSSTGMWDWDITAGVFYWSTSLQSLLGFKEEPGKLYDNDFFQTLLHDDSRDGFNEAIQDHLENQTPFHYEGKVIHQKKQIIWVSFRGQALWNEHGKAYRMLGSVEDVTDKRTAQKERNIYIQGVENSGLPFAIMETDKAKRNFTYVTQSFCDLTGHDADKLTQSNLNIFTGPETSMGDLDTIDNAVEQNIGIKTRILSYRVDGTSFWNEVTMEPIFPDGGEKASYYAVIFNDLTESLLREEKEINRQRNESLGALAASVAHEINNLLMPMTMAKDVLASELKENCDPFALEQLETIDEYALQAKEIVTGVLTFSRKETGKLEHTNIYNLLNSSVAFIGNLLTTKTTILVEEPADNAVKEKSAMVNLTEFRQIVTNLAKNSEHAFEGQSGQITISLSIKNLSNQERNDLDLRATEFVIIHFTDDGSGIPKEILTKIFDPLFTTKDIGHGTGLGLSVVHGIIRSWGGTIQVESTEGVGTKFDIYIPVKQDHDDFEYLADLLDEDEN